jgi:hypothetical protein
MALHCKENNVDVFEIFDKSILWSFVGLMERK